MSNHIKLKTVNVSAKGQIAIPAEIRKMLGIKKGDRLLLTAARKKILIEKSNETARRIDDELSYLTKISEKTAKKMWDNEKDSIWDKF
ncbi:MAG: AbrB/MazE/SpoVT family DNA-binding domain-containing protein [Candidatus Nitrosotenuis sp.]|jgi:AbrB family looped-hinge helix DNA binding protein